MDLIEDEIFANKLFSDEDLKHGESSGDNFEKIYELSFFDKEDGESFYEDKDELRFK